MFVSISLYFPLKNIRLSSPLKCITLYFGRAWLNAPGLCFPTVDDRSALWQRPYVNAISAFDLEKWPPSSETVHKDREINHETPAESGRQRRRRRRRRRRQRRRLESLPSIKWRVGRKIRHLRSAAAAAARLQVSQLRKGCSLVHQNYHIFGLVNEHWF